MESSALSSCHDPGNGVAAELAVVAIVCASKPIIRRFAQLGGREEGLPLLPTAAEPLCGHLVLRLEGPSQILDLDKLADEGCAGIVSAVLD
jgi:hypothetical protein